MDRQRLRLLRRFVPVALALALLLGLLPGTVAVLPAQDGGTSGTDWVTVAKVKSAYVLNFAKFSEWPSDCFNDVEGQDPAPLVIGVLGPESLGFTAVLENLLAQRRVGDRTMMVRRIVRPPDLGARPGEADPDDPELASFFGAIEACQVLYVAHANHHEPRRLDAAIDTVLDHLRGRNVLTVGDVPGFTSRGGMLGLVLERDHIVFEANPDAIQATRIRVSSKVLSLARLVRTEGR